MVYQQKNIMNNFTVYWNNEKTAYVDLSRDNIVIHRYCQHPVKQIFAKDTMTRYEFAEVLKLRCWDEHRDNIKNYLKKVGISEFNPYEICKHTHGVMFGSKIWFCFDGEQLMAEDVLIKG